MNIILQKPGGPNEYNFPYFSFIVSSRVFMLVILSCPILCDTMGFSVRGTLQAEYWSGLPFPSPGLLLMGHYDWISFKADIHCYILF